MRYKTRFGSYDVKFVPKYYSNGKSAILMVDEKDVQVIAKVTLSCPDVPLEAGEFVLKNYADNRGLLDFMLANGLVTDTGRTAPGYHPATPIVRITDKMVNHLKMEGFSDPWITPGKFYGKAATG